jgi:hypothetical protein
MKLLLIQPGIQCEELPSDDKTILIFRNQKYEGAEEN